MTSSEQADSSQFNLHQIGRTNLHNWARNHQSWLADQTTASSAMQYALRSLEAAQNQITNAPAGHRFDAAQRALTDKYPLSDGADFVTGDGFYGAEQAAGLLTGIGFRTDDVVAAVESRLNEDGSLNTYDFADALAELSGEPEASGPYLAAGHASRDADTAEDSPYRDAGTYHPSINLTDYFPDTTSAADIDLPSPDGATGDPAAVAAEDAGLEEDRELAQSLAELAQSETAAKPGPAAAMDEAGRERIREEILAGELSPAQATRLVPEWAPLLQVFGIEDHTARLDIAAADQTVIDDTDVDET